VLFYSFIQTSVFPHKNFAESRKYIIVFNQVIRHLIRFTAGGFILLLLSTISTAQNCKKLTPAGEGLDDAARINDCLQRKGFAKLKGGTFLLYSPIIFPRNTPEVEVSGITLTGRGKDATKLVVQSQCNNPFALFTDTTPGQYQWVIQTVKSPEATINGFELDVTNLRQDCGFYGNYLIFVNKSRGSKVTGVRLKGSPFGIAGTPYTTGGANGGGILVVNSEGATVTDNDITDIGFTFENGGESAGYSGIHVASSGNSVVARNRVEHVAFGIVVSNGSAAAGYLGDSSGTMVDNNTIIGAANIFCPNCSQGRAIKLQACETGAEPPLANLKVTSNHATEFGGHNNTIGGSGIDLVCGVQNSLFENNRIVGAPTAEFALQIRSSFFEIPPNPSFHNKFQLNTFVSGRGSSFCRDDCVDVNFTHDGPDQIGLRRNGENFKGSNAVTSFRAETDRGCDDYAHPYFLYLNEREFVRPGEQILLTALGVRPGSQVIFKIRRATDNTDVLTHTSVSANRYCIMNQEYIQIDGAKFAPGDYKIFADYKDGNSDASISNDLIGTFKVKPVKNE
jgi:hypothetical protein